MIRHIVMWKFREGTEEKANEFLTKLAALDGVIPQLKKSEVARNIGKDNYDAVLVSEFETMDDLNAYKVDPRHGRRERYLQVHPRRPRGRRLRNVNSKRGSTAFAVLPLFAVQAHRPQLPKPAAYFPFIVQLSPQAILSSRTPVKSM